MKEYSLHPVEIEVLEVLKKEKDLENKSLDQISKDNNIDYYKLYKGCIWLKDKKILDLIQKEEIIKEYTEYGKKCLKIGLPEERLIKELKENNGELSISEIKSLDKKEIGFTIGLLKKHGLIKVDKGKLKLLSDEIPWSINDMDNPILKENKIIKEVKKTKYYAKPLVDLNQIKYKEEINQLTPEILAKKEWKTKGFRKYDLKKEVPEKIIGKLHFYNEFVREIKEWLISRGFKEMIFGNFVIPEFYNFDVLYQPQNHPARDWTDTYSIKGKYQMNDYEEELAKKIKEVHEKGWKYNWSLEKALKLMPRAHITAVSAYMISNNLIEIPGKYFGINRVTRPDDFDATHDVEFDQLEGFVVGPDLNFRELLGMLKDLSLEVLGLKNAKIKFWPDYFPFTEPSVQISIKHPKFGWLELGGAGIFREEFTKTCGIEEPVIAWGLGIGRLAMIKLELSDIRDIYTEDIDKIRKFKTN